MKVVVNTLLIISSLLHNINAQTISGDICGTFATVQCCYFYISPEIYNWHTGRTECQNNAADLAILDTNDKLDFILGNLPGGDYYIGLMPIVVGSTVTSYGWINNSPMSASSSTRWDSYEPDYEDYRYGLIRTSSSAFRDASTPDKYALCERTVASPTTSPPAQQTTRAETTTDTETTRAETTTDTETTRAETTTDTETTRAETTTDTETTRVETTTDTETTQTETITDTETTQTETITDTETTHAETTTDTETTRAETTTYTETTRAEASTNPETSRIETTTDTETTRATTPINVDTTRVETVTLEDSTTTHERPNTGPVSDSTVSVTDEVTTDDVTINGDLQCRCGADNSDLTPDDLRKYSYPCRIISTWLGFDYEAVDHDSHNDPSTIVYTCEENYEFLDGVKQKMAECGASEKWIPKIESCEPISSQQDTKFMEKTEAKYSTTIGTVAIAFITCVATLILSIDVSWYRNKDILLNKLRVNKTRDMSGRSRISTKNIEVDIEDSSPHQAMSPFFNKPYYYYRMNKS